MHKGCHEWAEISALAEMHRIKGSNSKEAFNDPRVFILFLLVAYFLESISEIVVVHDWMTCFMWC